MDARASGSPPILPLAGAVSLFMAGPGRNFQVIMISIVSARMANARFTMKAIDLASAFPILRRKALYELLDYGQCGYYGGRYEN